MEVKNTILSPYVIPGLKRQYMPVHPILTERDIVIHSIIDKVSKHFRIDRATFEAKKTTREVRRVRNIIWTLIKEKLPKITYREIGESIGLIYDHSSVILGIRMVRKDEDLQLIRRLYF